MFSGSQHVVGYSVDVINYTNRTFTPHKQYSFFVDPRQNLERLSPLLNSDCVKVMHIETAHRAERRSGNAQAAVSEGRPAWLHVNPWDLHPNGPENGFAKFGFVLVDEREGTLVHSSSLGGLPMTLHERLEELFQSVFNDETLTLTDETTISDIAGIP